MADVSQGAGEFRCCMRACGSTARLPKSAEQEPSQQPRMPPDSPSQPHPPACPGVHPPAFFGAALPAQHHQPLSCGHRAPAQCVAARGRARGLAALLERAGLLAPSHPGRYAHTPKASQPPNCSHHRCAGTAAPLAPASCSTSRINARLKQRTHLANTQSSKSRGEACTPDT